MSTPTRVLVALDGSRSGDAVASVAVQLARTDPSCVFTALHVLTVRGPSGNIVADLPGRLGLPPRVVSEDVLHRTDAVGAQLLEDFRRKLPAGVAFTPVLERGAVTERLAEHAQHAELTLMGLHGETEDQAPGTGGSHVMRTLAYVSPVMLVHHGRPAIRRVAIGYDGSASAAHALSAVRLLVQSVPVPVDAIHVGPDREGHLHQVNAQLPSVDVTHHIVEGEEPHVALASTAHAVGADVLALGFRGPSSWRDFLFGSATEYILENTTLSLLIAH